MAAKLSMLSRCNIHLYVLLLIFLPFAAFSFVQEVIWVTLVLGLWGTAIGACMSLYPIIMLRYMGTDLFVAVLGVTGVVNGAWMLCCGPAIGKWHPWTQRRTT